MSVTSDFPEFMLATSTAEQYSFISFKLLLTKLAQEGTLRRRISTFIIRIVYKINFIKYIYKLKHKTFVH